jgi:hypothetical protein
LNPPINSSPFFCCSSHPVVTDLKKILQKERKKENDFQVKEKKAALGSDPRFWAVKSNPRHPVADALLQTLDYICVSSQLNLYKYEEGSESTY